MRRAERITPTMVRELAKEQGLSLRYDSRGGYSVVSPQGTLGTVTLRETLAYIRGYADGRRSER